MAEPKVVGTIAPAVPEEVSWLKHFEELRAELVTVKARLAESMNELIAMHQQNEQLRQYVQRSVRRVDATTSRLQRERAAVGKPRG